MSWIDERDERLPQSIAMVLQSLDEKWFGYSQNQGTVTMDASRLSDAGGYGPIERVAIRSHHQRHVSIDHPSSSISSFQFQGGLEEESAGSSPAPPPGFKPLAPWPMVPHSSSIHPSTAIGRPIKDAALLKDTALHHHDLIHPPGSLQPLTLQNLLASLPPSTPLGSSLLEPTPADIASASASAPLDVGGSQRRGTLYSSSAIKAALNTKHPVAGGLHASPLVSSGRPSNTSVDSLEQAFLFSKDTPPHEQLLGPTSGSTAEGKDIGPGSDLRSILSYLPRHLKVNIPQQQQPSSIAILQAAGQNRSSQSVYNDMVTVGTTHTTHATHTQPIAARRKAGPSQATARESYKAIQEMKINKVRMPPLSNHALVSKRIVEDKEPKDDARKTTEKVTTGAEVPPLTSESLDPPVIATEPQEMSDKPPRSSVTSSDIPAGSLSHSFSKLGGSESSAWIGGLIPAATIGDCPLEVGSFRIFLFRVNEGLKPSPSTGATESLNPKTWTGRSKLVLRACRKNDVGDIASCLMEELNAAAASYGYDRESCQQISVIPLGSGVVEPSGGQGRVFLSVSTVEGGQDGKPSVRPDPKASQAVDVPLVMEALLRTALPQGYAVHHVHLASPADSPTTGHLMKDRF